MFPRLSTPVELEEEIRRFWEDYDVVRRGMQAGAGKPSWVFYEGPPTANGTPHNGHVLTRVMKDVFPRFRAMQGFDVPRKAGWDTHGLPVEVEVAKELGLKTHADIEAYGLEAFNRACRDNVFTYIHEWNELTRDIGFWVDLDDPYVTFHKTYVESVWWALSRLFEKGLLYQGHKVVWWWPQGGTTLSAAEVGLGYKSVDDPAATVRFRDIDQPSRSYLAWTTTPWTLPSNVALAVGPDVDYAICDDPEGGEVVLALARAETYGLSPKEVVKGESLLGKRYRPPFSLATPEGGEAFVIVPGAHVTTTAGTGIVHTAPAYGEEDMEVARAEGLGLLQLVGPDGAFVAGTPWQGRFCKEADSDILRELKSSGLLFKWETFRHDYPFCWRASGDPLIQLARPAWFIRTTSVKDKALANNQAVGWFPEHIREGRFGDFLRNNVDWALSRERFWGTPLNIWTCEQCAHRVAPSSVEDLRARGAQGLRTDIEPDLSVHRPWIDDVTIPCPQCGGTMKRVPEVIDCWFDSGSMPFAQHGYPHQGKDAFVQQFPADFISEAIDQTRGWFYTLLMISTLLFDEDDCKELGLKPVGLPRPYRNCVVLGHVCDRYGLKESKSKGNYTSPNLVMRGQTWQIGIADASLPRGHFGLKESALESLELDGASVTLDALRDRSGARVTGPILACDVPEKDAIHVHPDDLAQLGCASGDKVWLSLPSEPPGADAFRWLLCAASPPWSNTRLSLRAIREAQREFLIRLRNVYQFFAIYADIGVKHGTFDPSGQAPRPVGERHVLDRWITHQMHATTQQVTEQLEAFNLYEASRALLAFIDDLSNWYVRRSRARFWREDADGIDALWTLFEVLSHTARLLAPFVPFHAEALWRALEVSTGRAREDASVHLQSWPEADSSLLDPELAEQMSLAREVASLGLSARSDAKIRVRQPLASLSVVLADPSRAQGLLRFQDLVLDELNVRELHLADDAAAYVQFTVKPDFRALGPKLGKRVKALGQQLATMDGAALKRSLDCGTLDLTLADGTIVSLTSEDLDIRVSSVGENAAASSASAVVALATGLTDDLRAEGLVRELTSRVAALRKEADLGYTDRIELVFQADLATQEAITRFGQTLADETLCVAWRVGEAPVGADWVSKVWDVDGAAISGWMKRLNPAL